MSKGSYDIVNPASPAIQGRVTTLLSIAKIEMILCYGVRRKRSERWTLFVDESQVSESTDIDVLIVIHPSEKHREHELVDRFNRLNSEELRLISLIHNSDAMLDSVACGSLFFQSVLRKGVLIYKSALFSISNIVDTPRNTAAFVKHWEHRSALAQKFLSGSEFYIVSGQYDLAAFMMHQSAENLCSAIIHDLLGYRVTTHNLNRLLSLTENFSPDISNLFPRAIDAERELFDLLSRAYSKVRYSDSFNISKDQAKTLYDKVAALISIVTEIHQRKSLIEAADADRSSQTLSFESIGLDTHHHIVLQTGDTSHITFEQSDIASKVKIDLDGKSLWISHARSERQEIIQVSTIRVTYTKLIGLVVNHAGSVTTVEPIQSKWLGVINNSNDQIHLGIDAFAVDVTLTKQGSIVLQGRVDDMKILNTGSGTVDALQVTAGDGNVTIKKNGIVKVNVAGNLLTDLSEEGQLLIKGNPDLVEV